MNDATIQAPTTGAATGLLGIGSQPVPSDLFAFLAPWRQVGTTVERESTHGLVTVSTFVDSWDHPTHRAVCSETVSIDDDELSPMADAYGAIVASADSYIDDHQADLFESWGSK